MEAGMRIAALAVGVVLFGYYAFISLHDPERRHRQHLADQARVPVLARLNPFRGERTMRRVVLWTRLGGVLGLVAAVVCLCLLLLSIAGAVG
jgi:hypothetical protein